MADRLLEVRENERHRLSRELHDDIGQLLTAAKLQSDWLQRRLPDETLQQPFERLRATLDETLTKVRDVSAILNPRQLHQPGPGGQLAGTPVANPGKHSRSLEPGVPAAPDRHSRRSRRRGLPITQEATTNILRHAHAENLLVRLRKRRACGYTSPTTARVSRPPPVQREVNGMAGMAERVANAGNPDRQQPTRPGHTNRHILPVGTPRPRTSQHEYMSYDLQFTFGRRPPLIRAGVRALVLDIPGYAVIGEASDGSQLLPLVEQLNPDIILLDISMRDTYVWKPCATSNGGARRAKF